MAEPWGSGAICWSRASEARRLRNRSRGLRGLRQRDPVRCAQARADSRCVSLERKLLIWYVKRWLNDARKGRKGEEVGRILDALHNHKGKIGVLLVFAAGGLKSLGYDGAAELVLTFGTLAGFGKLPNGPNAKQ